MTVPDSPSLRLTTGMTLEAWVFPTTVNAAWRDVIYKGNDDYYLEATSSNGRPVGGGTFGGQQRGGLRDGQPRRQHLDPPGATYDGTTLRLLRQRHAGLEQRPHGRHRHLQRGAEHRR